MIRVSKSQLKEPAQILRQAKVRWTGVHPAVVPLYGKYRRKLRSVVHDLGPFKQEKSDASENGYWVAGCG